MGPDKIEEMYSRVKGLATLGGVLKIECGNHEAMYEGYMDRSKGYTHGLVVYLESREALKQYNDDAAHVEVKDFLGTLVDKELPDPVMALDWELESSL